MAKTHGGGSKAAVCSLMIGVTMGRNHRRDKTVTAAGKRFADVHLVVFLKKKKWKEWTANLYFTAAEYSVLFQTRQKE